MSAEFAKSMIDKSIFNKDVFYGALIKADVVGAIRYLAQFPEQAELHRKYINLFENEKHIMLETEAPETNESLNEIFIIYQKYYRDIFYLQKDAGQAETELKERFINYFGITDSGRPFGEIEKQEIADAFQKKSYHFLGGKTGGYWGPYIWKTTESKTYDVELPDGRQPYTVKFLDGFLTKGWYDYVSFGEISAGGWTDGDGIIHCVKSSYKLEDESFTVSLLKHEAQHAMDLSKYRDMSSEDLEYRAKLVELIYSAKRNLLEQFIHEADATNEDNGHSLAASRIVAEFAKYTEKPHENGAKPKEDGIKPHGNTAEPGELFHRFSIPKIQSVARELLKSSNEEMKLKYCGA